MQYSASKYVISIWIFSNLLCPVFFIFPLLVEQGGLAAAFVAYVSMFIIGLVFSMPLLAISCGYIWLLLYWRLGSILTIIAWAIGLLSMTVLLLFIIWRAFFGEGDFGTGYWYLTGWSTTAIALVILFRRGALLQLVADNEQQAIPQNDSEN